MFRFELPQRMVGADDSQQSERQTKAENQPLPNLLFELHGSQFEHRATDRATKKFKQKHLSDL